MCVCVCVCVCVFIKHFVYEISEKFAAATLLLLLLLLVAAQPWVVSLIVSRQVFFAESWEGVTQIMSSKFSKFT